MAAQNAIQNPLLDEVSLKGAKAVLVNVTGGLDMTLLEVDEAANAISEQVDPEANIIFGAAFDPTLEGKVRVSVVATGMDGASIAAIEPKIERRSLQAEPLRATVTPRAGAGATPRPRRCSRAAAVAAAEPAPMQPARREQPDIFSAPLAAEAPAEPEAAAAAHRIVDPGRGQGDVDDAPLFAEPAFEPRKPRGGFLSIFGGRPRLPTRRPAPRRWPAKRLRPRRVRPPRRAGGAQPLEAAAPEEVADQNEDLEIPSFLRRLAN